MGTYSFLSTALTFLHVATSLQTPFISYISQEETKDIGDAVELKCSVEDAQDYPVLWIKVNKNAPGDQLPLSVGPTLIVRDNRFTLKHERASSTFALQIKDIQTTDAGFYQCQVLLSVTNRLYSEVELRVRRPPVITDNSTDIFIIGEGERLELTCNATGFPIPRISWRRENNEILPTGGSIYRGDSLIILPVRKEDRGTYYCLAENGIGQEAKHDISVQVEFAPAITTPRPRVGQALRYNMNLECHIDAYPPAEIVWLKDNVELSNDQRYNVSRLVSTCGYTDTKLQILNINKKDYGVYVCRGKNKLGNAETIIELFDVYVIRTSHTVDPIAAFLYLQRPLIPFVHRPVTKFIMEVDRVEDDVSRYFDTKSIAGTRYSGPGTYIAPAPVPGNTYGAMLS